MKHQPVKKRKKFHIGKGLRLQIYAWCLVIGVVMLLGTGGTFAWYSLRERQAETETANVMKPYQLSLQNASHTTMEQLSIGSLLQGETKQIVFCVTNQDESNTNGFEYELELIHTENLNLKYEIYHLTEFDSENGSGSTYDVIAEDILTVDGEVTTNVTYWNKGAVLTGTVVSDVRHSEAGLVVEDVALTDIVNRGSYVSYADNAQVKPAIENNLELAGVIMEETTDDDGNVVGQNVIYPYQYFVLEISWAEGIDYSKYDKETDMIYIVAKAVQEKPGQ